jgi:hypothetical protein
MFAGTGGTSGRQELRIETAGGKNNMTRRN